MNFFLLFFVVVTAALLDCSATVRKSDMRYKDLMDFGATALLGNLTSGDVVLCFEPGLSIYAGDVPVWAKSQNATSLELRGLGPPWPMIQYIRVSGDFEPLTIRGLELREHISLHRIGSIVFDNVTFVHTTTRREIHYVMADTVMESPQLFGNLTISNAALINSDLWFISGSTSTPVAAASWTVSNVTMLRSRLNFEPTRLTAGLPHTTNAAYLTSRVELLRMSMRSSVIKSTSVELSIGDFQSRDGVVNVAAVNVTVKNFASVGTQFTACFGTGLCDFVDFFREPLNLIGYSGSLSATNVTLAVCPGDFVNADFLVGPVFTNLQLGHRFNLPVDIKNASFACSRVNCHIPGNAKSLNAASADGVQCRICDDQSIATRDGRSCTWCGGPCPQTCEAGYRVNATSGECERCESGVVFDGERCECPPDMVEDVNPFARAVGILLCEQKSSWLGGAGARSGSMPVPVGATVAIAILSILVVVCGCLAFREQLTRTFKRTVSNY